MNEVIKGPYYPLYTSDFLEGTLLFNATEVGAYTLLLIYQWHNGFIPNDEKSIKKITKISQKKLKKVLEKFTQNENGNLINERVEKERSKFAKKSATQRENIEKRWGKNSQKNDTMVIPTDIPNGYHGNTTNTNTILTNTKVLDKKEGVAPPTPLPEKKELSYDFIKTEPEEYKTAFKKWLSYKQAKKQMYKTQETLEDAYKLLKNYSNNNPAQAMEVVLQSTGNNYMGLQPLKTNQNGNGNNHTINPGNGVGTGTKTRLNHHTGNPDYKPNAVILGAGKPVSTDSERTE